MKRDTKPAVTSFRPPIVAVLGHVDHGKTTLLDYIRSSRVAQKEHGGITQHIGAYQIELPHEKQKITFIDTPGHEAFLAMRSRGAVAADIALLVVAADDGVMPQTKESIKIITEAKTPMIVVVNKIDLPSANPEKIKQELARSGVQVEGFGGETPIVQVSASTGHGVTELLNVILEVYKKNPVLEELTAPLDATVIETRIDKGKGMAVSLIVIKGEASIGKPLYQDQHHIGKIRAMFDENGKGLSHVSPGTPAEVLGFSQLPTVGSTIRDTLQPLTPVAPVSAPKNPLSLPDFLSEQPTKKTLTIIIKADTAGSLEAILASLGDQITLVSGGVGDITEADILLAKSTHAFVIGFQVKCAAGIEKLAQTEGVIYRNYSIIYELLDELHDVIEGMEEVLVKERELGTGEIIAEFPFNGMRVTGTKVKKGRLARGDQVKLMRQNGEVDRAKIKSVRRGKEDITKAEEGVECGILFDKSIEFALGDAIIAFTRS